MSHNNTVFSQLLKLMPRQEFRTPAKQHHIDRSFRTATRWSQFVNIAMGQLYSAIKLHVGTNHAGYLPEFVTVTEGKEHNVTIGRTLKFSKGSIVQLIRITPSINN